MIRLPLPLVLLCTPCALAYIQIFGANGGRCLDECLKRRESYAYCETNSHSWDYCSPWLNVTSYGRQCRPGHACDNHGYDYRWCYTDSDNNWDYCSRYQEYAGEREMTRYGKFCTSLCAIREGNNYGCNYGTGQSWDYCSPQHNMAREGTICRSDHACEQHGNVLGSLYYWCRTKADDSWEYCSPRGDCTYWPKTQLGQTKAEDSSQEAEESKPLRATQELVPDPLQNVVCNVSDFGTRYRMEFDEETDSNSGAIGPDNPNYHHVTNIVTAYNIGRITAERPTGELFRNDGTVITYERRITRYQQYYNVLQLKLSQGALVSEVQLPQDETFSLKFLRRAFMNCVQRSCRTIILRYPAALKKSKLCV